MNKKLAPTAPVLLTKQVGNVKSTYMSSTNIPRPQLQFSDTIDNSNTPFIRKIKNKPNAKRPLDYGLPGSKGISDAMSLHIQSLGISELNELPHPYEYEISTIEYPAHLMQIRPAVAFKTFEEVRFTFVETLPVLEDMVKELNESTEFAVDLEVWD